MAQYDPTYDYSGFHHTNWDRVPLARSFPKLQAWLEAKGVSRKFLVLDVNQWFAGQSLAGAVLLVAARLWPKVRRRWRAGGGKGGQDRNDEVLREAETRRGADQRMTLTGMPT